jgi:hypothetical protein
MKKIFYHHIPKTGGQTLATRLASAFPLGRASIMGADLNYPGGIDELRRLLDGNDFVERHVNGPVLERFEGIDIVVTVREPVSQIVSNYLHILREPASSLHRPATLLSPPTFFRQFGDLLRNHQTRYFIGAYRDLHPDIERLVNWTSVMLDCLGRPRWIVPSEAIDEFCTIWQLETGRAMAVPSEYRNVAEGEFANRKTLEKMVSETPDLYAIDLLLWQAAKAHYCEYRRQAFDRSISSIPYANNWNHVWSELGCGIWLGIGWHQPQSTSIGIEYWAGPERLSEIHFKRGTSLRYMAFSVVVFCGVSESDIIFLANDGRELSLIWSRKSDNEVEYVVDLDGMEQQGAVIMRVPEVWSPVMVDETSDDVSRRSVATTRWRLLPDQPS